MGITNLRYGLEHRLSHLRGELETARGEVRAIEESFVRLSPLHERIAGLEKAIAAFEIAIQHDAPGWQPDKVKAVKPRVWKSPFKFGEMGRKALSVLQKRGPWLRPLDIAKIMLTEINGDAEDRAVRERIANLVGNYLKSHEGDLVESRGKFAKEWQVLR